MEASREKTLLREDFSKLNLEELRREGGIPFSNVGNIMKNEKQNCSIYVRKLLSAQVLWHRRMSRKWAIYTDKIPLNYNSK